jgi:CRISPR type I-D-associated protein Csc3/Cas10d
MNLMVSQITTEFVKQILPVLIQNRWHLLFGKGGPKDPKNPEQSLLTHVINSIFGLSRLLTFLEGEGQSLKGLDELVLKKVLVLVVLHDLHKILEKEGKSSFSISLEKVEEEYCKLGLDKVVPVDPHVIRAANIHARSSKHGDRLLSEEENASLEWLLVRIADSIGSMTSPEKNGTLWNYLKRLSPRVAQDYEFVFHEVKEIRGVLTNLIHSTLVSILQKYGFFPLLFFVNGTLYTKRKTTEEPYSQDPRQAREHLLNQLSGELTEALVKYGQAEKKTQAVQFIRAKNYDFQPQVYLFADTETLLEIVLDKIATSNPGSKFPESEIEQTAKNKLTPKGWVQDFEGRYKISLPECSREYLFNRGGVDFERRYKTLRRQSEQFIKIWALVYRYLLYVDGLLKGVDSSIPRLEWLAKVLNLQDKGVVQSLKQDKETFARGGLGKYTLVLAYHFLIGADFKETKAEQLTESEVLGILHEKVKRELSKLKPKSKEFELVYTPDLKSYLKEQVYFSFCPETLLEEDVFDIHIKPRTKGYPKYCFVCNRKTQYLQEARADVLDDNVRVFSNRIIPAREAPQGIYWCPVCSFEFTLRKLVGLSIKGDYNTSYRVYFYILPTYSFTPEHAGIFEKVLSPIRRMTALRLRDSQELPGIPRLWVEKNQFDADWMERITDSLIKEAERIDNIEEAKRKYGDRLYTDLLTLQPNYFLIVWEKALPATVDKKDLPTRTEIWAKAVLAALIFSGLTGARILVTEKPVYQLLNPNSFNATIGLDALPPILRSIPGNETGISLNHLGKALDVCSAVWVINGYIRRNQPDKHVAEIFEEINNNPLAGAAFYKRYARENEGAEPPEFYIKACNFLLTHFGEEFMNLVEKLAETSLEIALPFRGPGRGKFHRYEMVFRDAIDAVREAVKVIPEAKKAVAFGKPLPDEALVQIKELAAGKLLKNLERRQESRRGDLLPNPWHRGEVQFREIIEEMINLIVDELLVKRAHTSFKKFIELENTLADGLYFVIDRELPKQWDAYQRLGAIIKAFQSGELSLGEAARQAGMDKVTFMEELGKRHISVMNYPPEEIEQDLEDRAKTRSK